MNDNHMYKSKKKSSAFINVSLGAAWGLLGITALQQSSSATENTIHNVHTIQSSAQPFITHQSILTTNAPSYRVAYPFD